MEIAEAKARYFAQGYFIVDDAVEPQMLDRLEAAADRVRQKVRRGQVDMAGNGPDATAIFGVIAPEFGEPVFARYLIAPSVVRYVRAFLDGPLRLGHVHLWCAESGYDTGWHRDVSRYPGGWDEQKLPIQNWTATSLKWQLALIDDPCLWIVPASHRRLSTDQERRALAEDRTQPIDGQMQVVLKRGQSIFWNGVLIHRGRQPLDRPRRLSITGGLRQHRTDEPMEKVDERFRWRLAENIRPALPPGLQPCYDRWRALQKV